MQDNGVAREQKGLFFLLRKEPPMKEGTWLVANDGVMQGALGHAVQVRRGCALEEGNWRRRVEMETPVAGWQGKYDEAYVNRTCCIRHLNAEFVCIEDNGSALGMCALQKM